MWSHELEWVESFLEARLGIMFTVLGFCSVFLNLIEKMSIALRGDFKLYLEQVSPAHNTQTHILKNKKAMEFRINTNYL